MKSSRVQLFFVLGALPFLAACATHRARVLDRSPLEEYVTTLRQVSARAVVSPPPAQSPVLERREPALAAALRALLVFPSTEGYLEVAAIYRRLGILDKAHEHLALAVRMDRRNARAYDGMARIWRDWGFPNVALPDAHRAVYYAPTSPEAHNTLGTVLQALGSFPSAREEYERALALAPQAAYALNNLCTLDLLAGDAATAVRRCEQAVTLAPGLRAASMNLEQARATLRAMAVEAPDGRH